MCILHSPLGWSYLNSWVRIFEISYLCTISDQFQGHIQLRMRMYNCRVCSYTFRRPSHIRVCRARIRQFPYTLRRCRNIPSCKHTWNRPLCLCTRQESRDTCVSRQCTHLHLLDNKIKTKHQINSLHESIQEWLINKLWLYSLPMPLN